MINATDLDDIRTSFAARDEPGLPRSLAEDCARLLNVSDATISFPGRSDQITVSASSDEARALDEWEFAYQEGPGIDAVSTRTTATASTAAGDSNPWPRLAVKASAIGFLSIAGVPIMVQGTVFATLNLGDREGIIDPETVRAAEHVAEQLAPLIVAALTEGPSFPRPTDRDQFHQATGMVMAQMRVDAAAAADALRTHAWSHDLELMDVAAEVVARRLSFSPSPG